MQPSKVLFMPVGLASGMLAGLAARKLYSVAWHRISNEEAPEPEQRQASVTMLALSLALEGAIFRVTSGLVERGARAGFMRVTGTWPGDEESEAA